MKIDNKVNLYSERKTKYKDKEGNIKESNSIPAYFYSIFELKKVSKNLSVLNVIVFLNPNGMLKKIPTIALKNILKNKSTSYFDHFVKYSKELPDDFNLLSKINELKDEPLGKLLLEIYKEEIKDKSI
jgi:hypothetical protein